jgi:hypothetical protein
VTPQEECFSTRVVQELTRVDGQVEKVANFYVIQTGEQRYSTCGLPPKLRVAGTQISSTRKYTRYRQMSALALLPSGSPGFTEFPDT